MTILELQKELQEIYNKYGNMNVCFEDIDFSGTQQYRMSMLRMETFHLVVIKNIIYDKRRI